MGGRNTRLIFDTSKSEPVVAERVTPQLTCRDPAAGIEEESRVIVWERREQLATVAPRVLNRGVIHTMMRPGVGEFFRGFSDQCRAARQER